jgi:hypothetical protein
MNQPRPTLTEKTAAIAWARAWNTRDLELLRPLVHESIHISDQRRWQPRVGGSSYLTMIQDYFDATQSRPPSTRFELAQTPTSPGFISEAPRPCLVEYQRGRPVATILFHVRRGTIRQVERRVLPPPTECILTGLYPGIEETLDLLEVN